jgi:hypothetical protein
MSEKENLLKASPHHEEKEEKEEEFGFLRVFEHKASQSRTDASSKLLIPLCGRQESNLSASLLRCGERKRRLEWERILN